MIIFLYKSIKIMCFLQNEEVAEWSWDVLSRIYSMVVRVITECHSVLVLHYRDLTWYH